MNILPTGAFLIALSGLSLACPSETRRAFANTFTLPSGLQADCTSGQSKGLQRQLKAKMSGRTIVWYEIYKVNDISSFPKFDAAFGKAASNDEFRGSVRQIVPGIEYVFPERRSSSHDFVGSYFAVVKNQPFIVLFRFR